MGYPIYSYRISTGHDVALASLTNIEAITQIARPPRSAPVNMFPVRSMTIDKQPRGDGLVKHEWLFDSLSKIAFQYWLDTYFLVSGSYVTSRACTVYTLYTLATYGRYNVYLEYPKEPSAHDASDGDYRLQGGRVIEFRQKMTIKAKI